jgi:hypothetical protein
MLAACKARKESEVKRQRQMLKRRAAEAGKAAAQRAEEENRQ